MTVYELIQKLAEFRPDTPVEFHVKANFDTDVEAEFDRENESDVQDVTVTSTFDEDVSFADIDDNESRSFSKNIVINLEY